MKTSETRRLYVNSVINWRRRNPSLLRLPFDYRGKQKTGFLEFTKARVQVTAYALTDDFGPDPVFSNNAPARNAYAVPKHTLPAEKF